MRIDIGTLAFGYKVAIGGATPNWATALGQGKEHKINSDEAIDELLKGMVYSSVPLEKISTKIGKGGRVVTGDAKDSPIILAALFTNVSINETKIEDGKFMLLITRDTSDSHAGRLRVKYGPSNTYTDGDSVYSNQDFFNQVKKQLSLNNDACWFVSDIDIINQDQLVLRAVIVDSEGMVEYENSAALHSAWDNLVQHDAKPDNTIFDKDFNVFGMHITMENSALDNDNPHVCIGWSGLGDLSAINSKQELDDLYKLKNPSDSNSRKGANVSQIWMFKDTMKVGDYVVYFDGKTAHFGKIVGDYEYVETMPNQSPDYVNNRKVEWVKDIAYNDLPREYRNLYTYRSIFKLDTYKPLIEDILNGKEIIKDEFDDVVDDNLNMADLLPKFDFSASPITDSINLIVYGTPGCGKSYYVEHTLLKDYHKENYIRTTFFQDYTNTDFAGQILPKVENEKVTYEFNPGPFTLALEQAIRNPNERVALVIEELNRGSAASIFGDIFQLLDRKKGISEYAISNVNIINYLKEQFEGVYTFDSIKLPGNLSIFATMNTSDQNVFTLDTAFKRRWKFKKLTNKFEASHHFKNKYIPGANITWEKFVKDINEFILDSSSGLNSEDKQLGVYFVDEAGMREKIDDQSDERKVEEFAYKVLEYLWSDVAKFDRSKWFDEGIKSTDQLVEEYKKQGIGVFNEDVFKK